MLHRIWKSVGLSFIIFFTATFAFASQRYLVRYKHNFLLKSANSISLKSVGLESRLEIPQLNIVVAETPHGKKFSEANLTQLRNSPDVMYVEPSFRVHTLLKPNDPLYKDQQDAFSRLNIESAWETATGSSSVLVAVTDTGGSLNHEDLKNRYWKNNRDIPNNNVDDDGNGYVDDHDGWNFHDKNNNPNDGMKHGTHVSGLIGAEGNNNSGVSGINWNVKIMPIKFLDNFGGGNIEDAVGAIIYAADNGARIINASWGGGPASQTVKDAIEYAFNKGVLFIAAAGNENNNNDNNPLYPASFDLPGIISVAASQNRGELAGFSNYGNTKVSIVAPGKDMFSTVLNNAYGIMSGTSMATPTVSGVAALILSLAPNLSVIELRNAVLNAANPHNNYEGKIATAGDLDAVMAVHQISLGFQVWPSRMTVAKNKTFQFTAYKPNGAVTWSVSNPSIAGIDDTGTLTGLKDGIVTITAKDSVGNLASTVRVTIGAGGTDGTGGSGGGCSQAANENHPRTAGPTAMMGLALPVFVGAVLRRKSK